jgi:hypothetical protein
MSAKRLIRPVKLLLLCIGAAGANYLLAYLFMYVFKVPLFLDTVFNAAVCFYAGLIPGLITALLPPLVFTFIDGHAQPFVLCSIAEVLLIWRLKPALSGGEPQTTALPETAVTSFVGILARLMLLYIVCSIAISVIGGIIDLIYYTGLSNTKHGFSAEDAFKLGLLRSGIPTLAMNILSRIPVNIVDRFIVIFGGYFIARGMKKIVLMRSNKSFI